MVVRRSGPGVTVLVAALKELQGVRGKVGWFETAKYTDGTPIAYIAAVQELGDGKIPPRPFMRPTASERGSAWLTQLRLGASRVLEGGATATQVMESVTLLAAGDIAKTIRSIQSPPLSQTTLAARAYAGPNGRLKGARQLGEASMNYGPFNVSTKPLIWTGALIQQLTGVVEKSK